MDELDEIDGEAAAGFPKYKDAKRAFERRYITECLLHTKGNVTQAALMAGKDRKDFYDVLKRTGIDPNNFRPRKKRRSA